MKPRSGAARRAQGGQALVLGMLLAGLGALAMLRYFQAGQVVAAKANQLHAADAAAYSGALVQARALNMLAYLNRSQVAHQVAMAHLVTLGTWAMLGGTQAQQAATGNPPVYLIAMLFGAGHGAAYAASLGAAGLQQLAQGALARAHAAHDRIVHQVLRAAQTDIAHGVPDARMAAMRQVLAQHYGDTDFTLAVTHDNWAGQLGLHAPSEALLPFVRQVAGRFGFLAPRNHTARNPWPVQARCPARRHELRRRGATQLDGAGVWQSIDTQSFHALRSNRWLGCYYREYAMGYGWIPTARSQQAQGPYVEDPPDDFSAQDFWRWVREATNWDIIGGDANPLANSRAVAARLRWPSGGIPSHMDIAAGATLPMRFGVELRRAGPQGLRVAARAAAETFFQRPEPRADGLAEQANLFHPYWQARLAKDAAAAVPAGQP